MRFIQGRLIQAETKLLSNFLRWIQSKISKNLAAKNEKVSIYVIYSFNRFREYSKYLIVPGMFRLVLKLLQVTQLRRTSLSSTIWVNFWPESAPKCLGSSSMVRRTSALRLRQKKQLVIMNHNVLTSSIVKVIFFLLSLDSLSRHTISFSIIFVTVIHDSGAMPHQER